MAADPEMKKLKDHPAHAHLRGVLHLIDQGGKHPTAQLMVEIQKLVRTAVDVLMEPDPLKQRIAFILLAIRQATEVKEVKGLTKTVMRVRIIDQVMYTWALHEIHKLGV